MANRYHHTQRGVLVAIVLLGAAIVCAGISVVIPTPAARIPLWILAIGDLVLAWLFSSLTVDVNEHEISWYFGPGFWEYHLPLAEIRDVAAVRNEWWNGFGIRMRPGFRLYNVSGLDAVELRLKSGDVRRIGTDDANGLAGALKA
jgi:hypothetical protein